MAQTPQQRLANAKFAKDQTAKRGKAPSEIAAAANKKRDQKSPVNRVWLVILGFVIFGGLIFELLSRIFFR